MAGSVAPYTPAVTAQAAHWLSYVAAIREPVAADPACTVEDLDAATVEAIDKLRRRGCITEATAELLAEVFDLPTHA